MIPRRFFRITAMAMMAIAMVCGSCVPQPPAEGDGEIEERLAQLEELELTRQALEKELEAMDVPQLFEELQRDTERGVEPFNSMPYTEMVSRGEQAASELFRMLKEPTRISFLALLALRQMDAGLYMELDPMFRVSVLVDALGSAQTLNAWGLPHLYWEEAAEALIEEGEMAIELLVELLGEKRPAPMWGSEEVFEYQQYQYRIRDYAWVMLMRIQEKEYEIPTDPEMRDRLIEETTGY
jgi:hypothetical protein